jgi:ABC-type transport system substrate-binding protein
MNRLLLYLVMLACSFAFMGCSEGNRPEQQGTPSPVQGGTYRIPLLQIPTTLDPASVHDEYGLFVNQQIFDGLVAFGEHLLIEPALAKTWQVEQNGTIYRFTLRENVFFHDGNKLSARDVVFSLKRLLRIDPPTVLLPHLLKIAGAREYRDGRHDEIEGIEIPDEQTVVIRLLEPHNPFLAALGMYQAKIVSSSALERKGSAFGSSPVGTGPFRFVSWNKDSISLERFDRYYSGPAFLDGIELRIYPGSDTDSVLEDFKGGKLEEMPGYGNIRQRLPEGFQYAWLHRPALSLLFYGIRVDHPALADPWFRKALSVAIDRQGLVRSVYNGQFEPAEAILPPGMPGYKPPSSRVLGSMTTAQAYVTRAFGNTAPPVLEIVSASKSTFAQTELAFIKRSWAELGVQVEIRYLTDWQEFTNYIQSDQAMIYRYAWTADMPDPDNFITPLLARGAATNYMRYQNPEADRIIEDARRQTDPLERAQLYNTLEQTILEDSPLIPLFYLSVDRIYQSYVRDISLNALGFQDTRLHRVWLDSAAH